MACIIENVGVYAIEYESLCFDQLMKGSLEMAWHALIKARKYKNKGSSCALNEAKTKKAIAPVC